MKRSALAAITIGLTLAAGAAETPAQPQPAAEISAAEELWA